MNSKLKSFDPAVSIRKKSGGTLIAIRNCNDLSKKKKQRANYIPFIVFIKKLYFHWTILKKKFFRKNLWILTEE